MTIESKELGMQIRKGFRTVFAGVFIVAMATAVFGQGIPGYKVDPSWPKQLPKNWILGQVGGMTVDKDDHIWVFQRPRSLTADEAAAAQNPPTAQCCIPAPSVLEFDKEGNVIKSWGGPGYVPDWPAQEHGILVSLSLRDNFQTTRHFRPCPPECRALAPANPERILVRPRT